LRTSLRGAAPDLIINPKAAEALGLNASEAVLIRVDGVIE
jgi:hypothetical protein